MQHLFSSHRIAQAQHLTPRLVPLQTGQLGTAQGNHGVILLQLRLLLGQAAHRLGQLGFGLQQCQLGIGLIQLHQCGARLDQLGIIGVDADDVTGDTRTDRHHITGHIGIVSRFTIASQITPTRGGTADQ